MKPVEPNEISRLIAQLSDGSLTVEEKMRLNELLKNDPEAQEAYLDHMALDACLEREFGASAESVTAIIEEPQWGFPKAAWLAAAAAVLVSVALSVFFVRSNGGSTTASLARLSDVSEPVWAGDSITPVLGSNLGRAPLKLQSGAAQITFKNGVVLTLTGPAELDLVGPMQVLLRRGRVMSYVPPAGRGFTVVSPNGKIVDLGTEFSLDVDSCGHSRVYVVDGLVRVESDKEGQQPSTQLTTGYSANFNASMSTRIMQTPLLMDHFETSTGSELNADLGRRQSGGRITMGYKDLDADSPSQIRDNMLGIQLKGRHGPSSVSRIMLARDFNELRGCRYTITFKLSLPEMESMAANGWAAFVMWDGETTRSLPLAFNKPANFAVLLSPSWQVGAYVRGESVMSKPKSRRVFSRAHAAGPYQVVLTVDETTSGMPVMDLTVNGMQIFTGQRVDLGKSRYLGFHTWLPPLSDSQDWMYVDDLCVSLAPEKGIQQAVNSKQ